MLAYQLAGLGYAYVLAGRAEEGLTLLEESVEPQIFEKSLQASFPFLFQTEAYLRAGRRADAVQGARASLDRCEARGERGLRAWALYLCGEVSSAGESPDLAAPETSYREGLAAAAARSMRPLVAHCHLGLGKLYRRTGQRQEAQEHLTTATTMYRQMDMRFYLEQAEAEVVSYRARAGQTDGP
jgi:tetratricopeptide (TPR) repeat protein